MQRSITATAPSLIQRGGSLFLVSALAFSIPGCASLSSASSASNSSGSGSDSSKSVSTSVTSISKSVKSIVTSSSGSSSAEEKDKEKKESYRNDVGIYTTAFLKRGGNEQEFLSGLSRIAVSYGITNWKAMDATYSGIGQGLRRAGVDRANFRQILNQAVASPVAVRGLEAGYGSI